MRACNFFISGPKFTNFLFNSRVILLDNAVDRLSISQSVPEKVAVKVESSSTSRRILDVFFAFLNFKGVLPQKVVPGLTPPPSGTSRGKVSESNPLSSKVTGAHTLHFQPIFDHPLKKMLGKPPCLWGIG